MEPQVINYNGVNLDFFRCPYSQNLIKRYVAAYEQGLAGKPKIIGLVN